ncbi:MAG: thioredoxin domain-containing protein [Campylobacteraceae bacterium]|nr:thioredoxin domain-containing protein [Campylobacteraceae bacterium]
MKNKKIVFISLILLLAGFFAVSSFYKQSKVEELSSMSSDGAPFIRDHSPVFGNKDAKVTVVEWLDPECGSCRAFHPAVKKVLNEYKDEIKLVIRYVPNHNNSEFMIKVLGAAKRQNLYNEVLEVIYYYQPVWADYKNPKPKLIWSYLENVKGLDIAQLKEDFKDPIFIDHLNLDRIDGQTLKVRATPEFFVNGKLLVDFSYKGLLNLVESEIYKN